MALILLTCRLHEVDREVGYLQTILVDWFQPPPPPSPDSTAQPVDAAKYLRLLQEELTQFYLRMFTYIIFRFTHCLFYSVHISMDNEYVF